MPLSHHAQPDTSQFEAMVDLVIESLPGWVLESIDNLVIVVEDAPDQAHDGVLGLYEGFALTEREHYSGVLPDRITIFRQPHLALNLDHQSLQREIRTTVMHEIAHHLGFDDERLEDLGWG